MSVVSLQFGQCGNQIGTCLYTTIAEDISRKSIIKDTSYHSRAVNKWFDINKLGVWEPRSVLIDTECKVVQATESFPFKFKNIVAKSFGGSANNWACGYTRNGKILCNEVRDEIRKETEKCDLLSSFLSLSSSSGGTGSGVGSFILEQIKDDYPNKHIINCVVLPYVKGEIVTQSYNSLLTLSHLYSLVDGTILFENERLHYTCKHALDADVHFSHMNTVIAYQLAALYQPLQMRSEPHFSKDKIKFEGLRSWKTLSTTVSKQSRFDFAYQKHLKFKTKTICSALITRGSEPPTENDLKSLEQSNNYVSWLTKENAVKIYHQKQHFLNYDKYMLVVSNGNSVYVPLNFIAEDAWNLFNYGAYLHHYKKYGVDEEFFLNSFQILENILDSYKQL